MTGKRATSGSLAKWIGRLRRSRRRKARDAGLAKASARRLASKATFVGVTGSSAKSTTVALLSHILRAGGEVGEQVEHNVLSVLSKTLLKPLARHFVVVELGMGKPDSVRTMAELLKPDVGIVTLVGLEHYSAFRSREAVGQEKGALIENIREGGFAVLNADDPHVMAMAGRTAARIVTFGRHADAQYRAVDVRASYPDRLALAVEWQGGRIELATRYVAEHFWLPVTAAVAAALELGISPEDVAGRVATHEPMRNRFGILGAAGGPDFIVDTVKAPWHSLPLAFEALAAARAPRKRLVLGHMSDFPGADSKYRKAYLAAREICDEVIFVGDHAHRARASAEDRESGRFAAFRTPEAASDHIRRTATPGELILLKASKDLHLERIALSWTDDLRCWEPACGRNTGCELCGLFRMPYEVHRGNRNWRSARLWRMLRKPWALWRGRGRVSRAP